MISAETLKLWAEEDAHLARIACSNQATRNRYQARYWAAFDALRAMPEQQRNAVLARLECLDGPGCRSGTMAFIETLDLLRAHGIAEANQIFEHDRKQLVRAFRAAPLAVAAE